MARAIDRLASKLYPGGRGEIGFGLSRVVCEYNDVFPDELSGLPPYRDVDFMIELHLGTSPISMTSHRMVPTEWQELKVQLQELLDRGFIRLSTSPWALRFCLPRRRTRLLGCV